ncbi:MAG: ABC-F family ATP-binding cassette domain-containing protein [Caulobacteraceae bacterium]
MLLIKDLTLDAWGRRFLEGANATIPTGAKVGLVGRNGIGKSTLFRVILGELHATTGEVAMPKGYRIATVDQEAAASPVSLIDTVLMADWERHALLTELETAPPERIADIHGRLAEIGADRAPSRAAEILAGLGFSQADLERPMSEFSGGWRMRVALASALFAQPDLLLLDEPTNYLDLEGALWLEARLKRYPSTAIVISHDRELLNNSVEHILHLNNGKLDLYTGGYDDFERMRAEKMRLNAAARAKQDAERAHLQSFVDRFKAKASKAAQAQSRVKRLAKLPPIAAMTDDHVQGFDLPSPERPLAPPILRLDGASAGYGDRIILKNLTLRLDIDDRIGLLGVNGAGKSTFAKLIAGALPKISGVLQRDSRLKVGWFHQHQIEALDPTETPLDLMRRELPQASEASRRARLASYGLPAAKVETQMKDLSGGERARLLLNLVAAQAPHLLILDEPTNHLDIDSRRALLDALNDYEGAVVLITHDRSLMELVADRLWLAADGTIKPFDGDMDDYAKYVIDRARQSARAGKGEAAAPAKDSRKSGAQTRAQLQPLKKALDAVEQKVARISKTLAEIDAALADPKNFKRPAELAQLGRDRARNAENLEKAEAEWLEAAEAYETAKAAS